MLYYDIIIVMSFTDGACEVWSCFHVFRRIIASLAQYLPLPFVFISYFHDSRRCMLLILISPLSLEPLSSDNGKSNSAIVHEIKPLSMSKLSDYSKFDHLDVSDDETDEASSAVMPSSAASPSPQPQPVPTSSKRAQSIKGITTKHPTEQNRYIFEFGGQKVYEWEQSLEEVTIYIDAPPNLPKNNAAHYMNVNILPNRLQVGLKGFDRFFIDENTFDKIKVKESSWYLDDGVITIILAKCFRGQTWEGVLRGHHDAATHPSKGPSQRNETAGVVNESIDPVTKQEMQRTMMLERFQEENPGFDFRDATFNGEVPDPRTFMGGVGYNH